jgi:hypothetical protein
MFKSLGQQFLFLKIHSAANLNHLVVQVAGMEQTPGNDTVE